MKYLNNVKMNFLLALAAIMIFSACNKDVEQIPEPAPVTPTGSALGDAIQSNPDDSLYYRLLLQGGLLNTINNTTNYYTMFVPNNAGMKLALNALSGGLVPLNAPDAVFSGFIQANISQQLASGIARYNICPQPLPSTSIPATFPNFPYPTIINPAPALSGLVRLDTYPSTRNGGWINNIPLIATDEQALNGIIHHSATIATPPQRPLWSRISSDADLTILLAAIQRADSGVAPTGSASLIWALQNFGPSLTVFAPTNMAMKNAISFLTGGLIPTAAPDAVFIGFLGSNNISTQTVKGLIVYHLLGSRAFTNNFPTTAGLFPTLLNGAIPAHPGVGLSCTITPGVGVTAASVKGAGNPTASNILINPTPDLENGSTVPPPTMYIGTSDQHYINGTLHKIDQVLLPQ